MMEMVFNADILSVIVGFLPIESTINLSVVSMKMFHMVNTIKLMDTDAYLYNILSFDGSLLVIHTKTLEEWGFDQYSQIDLSAIHGLRSLLVYEPNRHDITGLAKCSWLKYLGLRTHVKPLFSAPQWLIEGRNVISIDRIDLMGKPFRQFWENMNVKYVFCLDEYLTYGTTSLKIVGISHPTGILFNANSIFEKNANLRALVTVGCVYLRDKSTIKYTGGVLQKYIGMIDSIR